MIAVGSGVAGRDKAGEIGAEELSETEENQHEQALSRGAPICSAIDGFRSLQMVARTRDSFDAKGGLKTIEN